MTENEPPANIPARSTEVALRLAVAEYLRSTGHQVVQSQSALDALEPPANIPARSTFSVTDVVMPEVRVPELARRVPELHPNVHVSS